MAASYKTGAKGKLYYNATALTSTPASNAMTAVADNVKNVKVSAKNDTADATTRANGNVKQYGIVEKDYTVTFDIKVPATGITDAAFTAFENAFVSGDDIASAPWTDTIANGGKGPIGNWCVTDFSISQGNADILFASVELKPTGFNTWLTGS